MEIHRVSGHMGVKGNEKADEVAKQAAEKADTQRYPGEFASLVHFRPTISGRKSKQDKH